MRLAPILALAAALLLGGCVIWHSNRLKTVGGTETLALTTTGAGLIPGPCVWRWGVMKETDAFVVLRGARDSYREGEFDILNGSGERWYGYRAGELKGTVILDRKRKTAVIRAEVKGKPFDYNGRHSYRADGGGTPQGLGR